MKHAPLTTTIVAHYNFGLSNSRTKCIERLGINRFEKLFDVGVVGQDESPLRTTLVARQLMYNWQDTVRAEHD